MAPRKTPSFSGAGEAQQGGSSVPGRVEGSGYGGSGGVGKSSGRRKREGPAEEGGLTEEDLSAPITIGLRETPTMMLLEVRGSAVAMDLRDFGRWLGWLWFVLVRFRGGRTRIGKPASLLNGVTGLLVADHIFILSND